MSPAQRSKAIARHRKPDSNYQDIGRIRAMNHLGEELTITEEQSLDHNNSKVAMEFGTTFPTTDYDKYQTHGQTSPLPTMVLMHQKHPLVKKIVTQQNANFISPNN